MPSSRAAVIALTVAALLGFAANSLACRAALGDGAIDAASFTAIRIGSGAAVLVAIAALRGHARGGGSWPSALALFLYAAAFSFAYLQLTTATGALILFAAVQITMLGVAIARGDRPGPIEWLGIGLALGGLVALVLPGLAAPDPLGAVLMASAGIAWGVYSLRGRTTTRPLAATADNFLRAVPLAAALLLAHGALEGVALTGTGVALAVGSGALASGLGYSLWYAALPHLAPSRAAIVQLSVPVIAAAAGVALLGEQVSLRLAGATAAILGGIAVVLAAKRR